MPVKPRRRVADQSHRSAPPVPSTDDHGAVAEALVGYGITDALSSRVVGGVVHRTRVEDEVVILVNEARAKTGVGPLAIDGRLREAARAHSADMARRGFVAHNNPDGKSPAERMRAAGYEQAGAENVARGQPRPTEVMRAWMNSPGHRANIVNPEFKSIGVGIHMADGGPWWTQNFGY